jgi:methionyl-tRNA formyltransferase
LRIIFFGSPDFAVPALAAVARAHDIVGVVTQPDRPAGRGARMQPPAVKVHAAELRLPVMQPSKLRDGVVSRQLAALEPDVFVVVAYGRILPPALLAVPSLGPWNLHASLLPKYRGAAPIQWAVIRGETETGVSIMQMEAGLDTGPVAAVATEPIHEHDTAGSLAERLALLGAGLLVETLPRIADGTVVLCKQDDAAVTLAPPLVKSDGHLDFKQPAAAVSARARGVDPWPGATVMLAGERAKVFLPKRVSGGGQPGEVLGLVPEGLAVACGESAKALLAGHAIPVGTVLG